MRISWIPNQLIANPQLLATWIAAYRIDSEGGCATVPDVAAAIGVSERSVRRSFSDLVAMGLAVKPERGCLVPLPGPVDEAASLRYPDHREWTAVSTSLSVLATGGQKEEAIRPHVAKTGAENDTTCSYNKIINSPPNYKQEDPPYTPPTDSLFPIDEVPPSPSKKISDLEVILAAFNELGGNRVKPSSKVCQHITARLAEGHSVAEILLVLEYKAAEWLNDPRMAQYFRIMTLFRESKFAGYLRGAMAWAKAGRRLPTQANQMEQRRQMREMDAEPRSQAHVAQLRDQLVAKRREFYREHGRAMTREEEAKIREFLKKSEKDHSNPEISGNVAQEEA
jgi:uncharacterized phage protein (TIGR02220 family)